MKLRLLACIVFLAAAAFPVSAQMPPISVYGDLPAIETGALSPGGTYTALLTTVSGERRIVVLDRDNKPIKQFEVGEAKVRAIEWIGEEAILLIRSESDQLGFRYQSRKVEWSRANVLPLNDDRPVVSVFADQRRIVNAVMGYYGSRNVGGTWKGYFASMRKGSTSGERDKLLDDQPALFEVDLATGSAKQMAPPSFYPMVRDWLIDDRGRISATQDFNIDTGDWRIENASGTIITGGKDITGSLDMEGFSAEGDAVIYSYFEDSTKKLVRMKQPLTGGAASPVYDENVRSFVRKPGSARIAGVITEEGKAVFENLEEQASMQAVQAAFEGGSLHIQSAAEGLAQVLVSTSGNYDSGSWYRYDALGAVKTIVGLERPAIQGPVIGKIEKFTYTAQDGLEINSILTLPRDRAATGLPVIILPHGGPTSHDELEFDWWAQALASRGYAVFQPNFRGSTNRGERFRAAGDGEWGRKMQTDLSDGLAALVADGKVDPDRACIAGASYGGYAALAGVTLQNGLYRCAVAVAPVTDLPIMFRGTITGRRDVLRLNAERLLGRDSDLAALSPARLANRSDAPILLIHGRDDSVVPFSQSALMADALKDAGKSVRLVSLDGEDHWLSKANTRQEMLRETIAFIEQHNPPD